MGVGKRYPGGIPNIRSLHIKTEVSPAVPIHLNTASGNGLGYVDASLPAKATRETVTGELSTQPGMEVTVTPYGTIKVKKTGDPLWDDEKDEPFVSGSEEENDEAEDNVHGGGVERLEHDLGHLLPVGFGVEGSLGEEDRLLLGGNPELVEERVMPDLLHVVPVGDDAVFHGVLQGEDTPLGLSFVADVGVLLSHTDHHTLMFGTTDDGGKDGPGSVVSGEAGLAHAGAVVDDQRCNVLVTHLLGSLEGGRVRCNLSPSLNSPC